MGRSDDRVEQVAERAALLRDIALIVANSQNILRTQPHAAYLLARYPNAGMSLGRVVDELVAAAVLAKVPVEISEAPPSF